MSFSRRTLTGSLRYGLKVEKHIDARHRRGLEVLEHLFRLGQRALRPTEIDIDAPQTLGDGPLEHAPAAAHPHLEAGLPHQRQYARFFAGLDDDEGHARTEQGLQLVARIQRDRWGTHAARM